MSFVSYSQNFEDVMLWRALRHVQDGLYIDVGAQHPVVDSVSKAFHQLGWKGIHVEPVPAYAEMLRADRPDDTVLQLALGETEGTLELNVIADTGLSTAVSQYAQTHQDERGFQHQRVQVPVLTMKSAFAALQGRDVHWLKIDVEGFEENVLRGWDSRALRPWIIVVEATIPNSSITDYAGWDPIILAADYTFVYFDGLNRFYVAKEHAELCAAFAAPPNVFDQVVLSGLSSWSLCAESSAAHEAISQRVAADTEAIKQAWERLRHNQGGIGQFTNVLMDALEDSRRFEKDAEQRVVLAQSHLTWLQKEYDCLRDESAKLRLSQRSSEMELALTRASSSWKLTAPLRLLARSLPRAMRLLKRVLRATVMVPARACVIGGMKVALTNPAVRARMLNTSPSRPGLLHHLSLLARNAGLLPRFPENDNVMGAQLHHSQPLANEVPIQELSTQAARIHAQINNVLKTRKK